MPEIPKENQPILSYRHEHDSHTLAVALKHGAYEGLRKALGLQPPEVTEIVKASGLRGRGGAGFPTGLKWSFMPKEPVPGRPHVLAVNADESEPGTFKDHEILLKVPHKLIEGSLITCWANHAHLCYVYVRGEYSRAHDILRAAVKEAEEAGFLGKNILGSGFDCEIVLHRGAGAYICGEETALLESLEGRRGYPRPRPPYAVTYGAFSLPTVINNVETIAAVPWIILNGAQAFRRWGTEKSPGSKIYSVSGHVNRPGNYECPLGTTLRDLIETAGGMLDGRSFKACFPGGTSEAMIGRDHLDIPMDFESLAQAGSMLGSGGVIVMDETTDLVKVLWRVSRFYERESCGKCTPCHQGTWWLRTILERILHGRGTPEDIETLRDISNNMLGQCFCLLGDSAAAAVLGLLDHFPSELDRHMRVTVAESVTT
jgi:NADH-quinone oxidoreductase subunit F